MATNKNRNLSNEQKEIIKQLLIKIFKSVFFNDPNILKAKKESDNISEEIRKFILHYIEENIEINEIDLLLEAKQKGLELVENHNLVFFEENVDKNIRMRGFLIPGIKIEDNDNSDKQVTEDDMQAIDHELCVSFKTKHENEFTKLGNLIDIRATLAKALSNKLKNDKEVPRIIEENYAFKESLENIYSSLNKMLN